jgi:endonuclease/exonuclease/phosphatase family metal-dependent hydrolase
VDPAHRLIALALASSCAAACSIEDNYLDPDGPAYANDCNVEEPVLGDVIRVVSYNLEFGREVPTAIDALRSELLAGADFILMQEMDDPGVSRIAEELGLCYVYYPASVKHGRDWGNAILSRWKLLAARKILLPWADPYSNTRRIGVTAHVELGGRLALEVYTTHIATPSLGLGARLDQIEEILNDADGVPIAFIGGDLNTVDPGSAGQVLELFEDHGFTWVSDDATDTGSGFGIEVTLDYVFARGLRERASGTFDGESGSDHQPVWVELELP